MEIVVRGKHREVPARLRKIAREKVTKISRFARDVDRVEVEFSEVGHRRAGAAQLCEVTVHLKRHFVKAHASAREPEEALDLVIDKVEHQVARIKDRRVSRSHPRRRRAQSGPANDGAEASTDDDGSDDPASRIVKTKQFTIKPMSPEEAALQMDLLGHDFFLFTNTENGHAAVLYKRRDGNLGLIETSG
jgi:ribosome hibernation promoting factor